MRPCREPLRDGRWHFQHGPIDLIIHAEGEPACVKNALDEAWRRFQGVLDELVTELRTLRRAVPTPPVEGAIARRMVDACMPFASVFITPMAAVAGAVADDLITHFQVTGVTRAYVNNGGDIALHLSPDTHFRVGLCADPARKSWKTSALDGRFDISFSAPVRGIATSGWRGRSFSFGVADSVTVLAHSAARADAAATLVANAVNVESGAVTRRPANSLKDDTDLGDRLVTVDVGSLSAAEIECALQSGLECAQSMRNNGLIHAAVLKLGDRFVNVGG